MWFVLESAGDFLEDFIKQNQLPLVVPINFETLKQMGDDKRRIVVTFLEDEADENSQKLVKILKSAASANRDLVFAHVGVKQWEEFTETFGINKKSELPKMLIWDGDEEYLVVRNVSFCGKNCAIFLSMDHDITYAYIHSVRMDYLLTTISLKIMSTFLGLNLSLCPLSLVVYFPEEISIPSIAHWNSISGLQSCGFLEELFFFFFG